MKRPVLAVLVAALALVISIGGVAVAASDDAGNSAKKAGKGKKKGCKAKGEGKHKGKRSAGSSAKKKSGKKKNGKKRGCKAKGKDKKGGWPLNGYYEGRGGISLSVAAPGKKVELVYSPADAKTCIEHVGIGLPATSVTSGSSSFEASGEGNLPNGQYSWSIAVNRDLTYRATISSSSANPFYGPCDRPGAVFTGKLKKVR